ncbi:hypothetical protein ACFFV7_21730 [Nonomuraea spiralis]|uniref:GerMN domain-containing protein n=1 Tax=Nonomuraea spiralis TaxID=46182 RepID=A0ABV5IHI2_9ACTN|nr:GerMN domain-containing protein [Nonomuraea spiralis]GGS97383.1 hypothetical protein GCM10010176_046550 [Nonomuraea spiralis]
MRARPPALLPPLPPVLTLVLLLVGCTACGVGPTAVIGAGEPARGFIEGTRLYFVQDDRLVSVGRPEGPLEAAEAVELLTGGPTSKERERSIDTTLPKNLAVRVTDDGFTLTKGASTPVSRLSRTATGQIVCTIAAATAAKRGIEVDDVRVTVPTGGQTRCEDFT